MDNNNVCCGQIFNSTFTTVKLEIWSDFLLMGSRNVDIEINILKHLFMIIPHHATGKMAFQDN